MKKFVFRALSFLLMPFLVIIITDIYLRTQNTLYKEKFSSALQNKDSVEIIILGNSHANYGVDPKKFDLNTFNLANVNQSIYFDKRLTLKLLENSEKLEYVFISLDFHSLYFSDQGIRNVWSYYGNGIKYKNQNYLLENLSPSLFGYPPKVTLSIFRKRFLNYIKYGDGALDIYVEKGVNPLDSIYNGYIGYEGTEGKAFLPKNLKSRAKTFNKKYKNQKIKEEVISDLKSFIRVLKKNNITPILFTSPTFQEYNGYLKKEYIAINNRDIEEIRLGENLIYWNFMDSPLFSKEDFYDGDHLNKRGAAKFSQILNDSLNSTMLNFRNNSRK